MGWEFSKNGEKQKATDSTISQNSNDMNMKGNKFQINIIEKMLKNIDNTKILKAEKEKKNFFWLHSRNYRSQRQYNKF